MRTRVAVVIGAGLLTLVGLAHGAPVGESSDPGERLDLSIRARGLGVAPMTPTLENLGLETVKAPSGAGSIRMPSATTQIAPGVYFTVDPTCLPNDDPFARRVVPPSNRRR